MTVSVIVPYIESSDLILKTADSLKNQHKTDTSQLQLLVADATQEQSAKEKLASYTNVRIVAVPGANEAEAYNAALKELDSDCAIPARPGDVFGSHYFMNALKALNLNKPYAFAAPQRFCINPVYSRYKYISRTNVPLKQLNTVADIRDYPNLLQMEPDGNIIKSEVLKQYPADPKLKFEYFHDVMLRLQRDHPTYYAMGEANFNSFMPLSDDSAYFVPSNRVEWYRESVESFMLPLAERFKNADDEVWNAYFFSTEPDGYFEGAHMDLSLIVALADTLDEKAIADCELESVKRYIGQIL